ncbi:hypothetical protein [Isoptericola sp. NPDC057191]|uniref:hypothetical protein n=1 Tax=Isoptericola sp. NPDC057191 TaxID=3346041 RepID=UPI00362622A5
MIRHARPGRAAPDADDDGPLMPVRTADETYGEVRETARRVLPGARYRQRLFFRYTLEWTRPAGPSSSRGCPSRPSPSWAPEDARAVPALPHDLGT